MGRPVKQLFQDVATALSFLVDTVWSLGRQLVATGNAAKNIKSARCFPVGVEYWRYAKEPQDIYLGNYHCYGLQGSLLDSISTAGESTSVSIPWQTNDWRRNSPYHTVYLYLPFIGIIHIPSSEIISDSQIIIETTLTQSGMVVFRLYGTGESLTNAHSLGEYTAQVSSDFFIGSSNTSGMAYVSGAAVAIGAAVATGGASTVAGGLAAASAGILGTINAIQPLSNGGGSGGGIIPLQQDYRCYTVFHDTSVSPDSVASVIGTPTMAVKTIGTLSGYVQTACASVNVAAEQPIRDKINQLLDGGIFYE